LSDEFVLREIGGEDYFFFFFDDEGPSPVMSLEYHLPIKSDEGWGQKYWITQRVSILRTEGECTIRTEVE
jgi:hypothetical protein